MDKTTEAAKPANQQAGIDWFSFHQGADNTGRPDKAGDQQPAPGPKPGQDPYDYNQGPSKQGDPAKPGKRQSTLTLYDVAESTLKAEGKKSYKQDDIYFRLNDMMVSHGFQKANIDGRSHINDHMLPKSWNMVDPHKLLDTKPADPPKDQPKDQPKPDPAKDQQKPGKDQKPDPAKDKAGDPAKDQSPEAKARAEYQKKVEDSIKEKFTLPPVEEKKGYYDTVAKVHPDWKPKQILEEAKRIRHLNNDSINLSVGERLYTISKDERQKMLSEAMAAYDKQLQSQAQGQV